MTFPRIGVLIFCCILTTLLNLLVLLPEVPYGYFVFLKISTFGSSLYLLYYFSRVKSLLLLGAVLVAIVDNPILQVRFSRSIWNLVDLGIAVYFFVVGIVFVTRLLVFTSKNGKVNRIPKA